MPRLFPYKSFCWSLGTTSFRTRNFNETIETQLALLQGFWSDPENGGAHWVGNNALQGCYYQFMKNQGFLEGDASNKPKDAREKTSGLVDIGLINDDRRLTEVGHTLLAISQAGDFSPDNFLQIPKDSFLYLKQLLKTNCDTDEGAVRPFIVLLYVLSQVGKLTHEQFKFLLPLCTTPANTEQVLHAISNGTMSIDEIIISRLMEMENYQRAQEYFLAHDVDEDVLCEIGMNRKSRNYDRAYLPLYRQLYAVYLDGDVNALPLVYDATKQIKIGIWWRNYLFSTSSRASIERAPADHIRPTAFDTVMTEAEFKRTFFQTMHLLKAKATLSDYFDLNRRYIQTTDVVLFEDDEVKLDVVPKYFFNHIIDALYHDAYCVSNQLERDCALEEIHPSLVFDEAVIISGVNHEFQAHATTLAEACSAVRENRYARLQHLIDTKFSDEQLLHLLDDFERRDDSDIQDRVTDNADVPTIFEYVLGILWYKVSERQGDILEYMKLSLDADLLPRTHAAGGDADIVYEYAETTDYPEHTLLLEATLADRTNQRRMEMEPVSRHLGQHLLRTGNLNSYCVFATNFLDINVMSDFRGRKAMPYYDPQDYTRFVEGMKIIPLQTAELKKIIQDGKRYCDLYPLFETAFQSTLPPNEWYDCCVKAMM